MPLSLEEEAKLLPLAEKASDLMVKLIMKENSDLGEEDKEFHKTVKRISAICPFLSKIIYLDWYNNRFPKMKSRLLDWVKDIY